MSFCVEPSKLALTVKLLLSDVTTGAEMMLYVVGKGNVLFRLSMILKLVKLTVEAFVATTV
jgi:hypothetical protein